MTLKNLMVHLDQGERTPARLDMAIALARQYQARLVGVFGQRAQAQQIGIVATWPSEDYVQAAAAAKARFEQATAGVATGWLDINRGGDAELLRQIADTARYADLMVLSQHDENARAHVPAELPEQVVLHCGRPVLILPYAGVHAAPFRRPLIAWSPSREAARALNDALPLLAGCDMATVVVVDTGHEDAAVASAAVVGHLACHGIPARGETVVVEDIGIMDMLLNRVTDRDADLLVMGAHAHSSFPFLGRGAGTRHILNCMTVPVLMSN